MYAYPEFLVETDWVAEHLKDPRVRLIESDEDYLLYETGHIPGAVKVDWFTTLQHAVRRDFLTQAEFEALCSQLGIANDTTLVFYGDRNNWFACYAFWLFEYYGHKDLKIMNGGRAKWAAEGRPMTKDVPQYPPAQYQASQPNETIRAYRDEVLRHVRERLALVDVRSPQEFTGELLHMPNYPQEGAQRGGHIPGAVNIPWSKAVREDGTFRPPEELRQLYQGMGIQPEGEVIAYCRIGERSSLTWFVLKYLLGYPAVKKTTMVRGPSGATWWARRLKKALPNPRHKRRVESKAVWTARKLSKSSWTTTRIRATTVNWQTLIFRCRAATPAAAISSRYI